MTAVARLATQTTRLIDVRDLDYVFRVAFWVTRRGKVSSTGLRVPTAWRVPVEPGDTSKLIRFLYKLVVGEASVADAVGRPFVIVLVARPRTLDDVANAIRENLDDAFDATLLKHTRDTLLLRAASGRLIAIRLVHDLAALEHRACDLLIVAKAEINTLLHDTICSAIASGAPPVQWIYSDVELDARENLLAKQFAIDPSD